MYNSQASILPLELEEVWCSVAHYHLGLSVFATYLSTFAKVVLAFGLQSMIPSSFSRKVVLLDWLCAVCDLLLLLEDLCVMDVVDVWVGFGGCNVVTERNIMAECNISAHD